MRYSTFDIPDLPLQAFQKSGRGIRPQGGGKGGGSKPDVPDYTAAAQAQAQGNLDLAKYATQANRVNQVTPWGSITWSNAGAPTFNQDAYNQAMQAYSQSAYGGGQGGAVPYDPGYYDNDTNASIAQRAVAAGAYQGPGGQWFTNGAASSGGGSSGAAPNPADFYTGGGQDNWTQTVNLSPEMQALFNQQMGIQQGLFGAQNAALGRVNSTLSQPFDTSGVPGMGSALDAGALPGMGSVYDPTQSTNNATDLILQRVNPQLDRQQEQLRAQLANQGISMGSAAYNNALGQFQQGRNDAYSQAALQGIGLGMQQQAQTYGQQTTNRQLAAALQNQQFNQQNQLHNTGYQEAAYQRSLPLNELAALTTGQQVQMPQFPGYSQQATTGGPDYMGAANSQYAAQLGASNAAQAQNQNFMGGLFGLAGTGLGAYFGGTGGASLGGGMGSMLGGMFSDRRVKRHIKLLGKDTSGLNIYSYQYIWGGPTHVGFMADEVAKIFPDAVSDFGGIKMVDYAKVA